MNGSSGPEVGAAISQEWTSPKQAVLVVPVWGQRYVQDFLRFSLPTLLAPGNIPAIAETLPAKLVILTSAEDAFAFEASKLYARIAGICDTELRTIDHLITDGNHSTTITLAMAEAVLACGAEMVDTCFFFLVSDYIVADGSLGNVLRRILEGASGVLVGNFQVTRERAVPWLRQKLAATGDDALRLHPRDTVRWALQHLHPATIANIVNVGLNHNTHSNRLFWRVNSETLIGRFYLRHPLCIRPETTDFKVGSSADYSFIPEMCPSGNVVAIVDSDEYLAIEMQPERHEGQMLRFGMLTPKRLGRSLSEWATREHRENVSDTHLFHASARPSNLEAVMAEADEFINVAAHCLRGRPHPHRGHRYWKGALAGFFAVQPGSLPVPLADHVVGTEVARIRHGWRWRWQDLLLGRPPRLRPWAPDWADVRVVLREIDEKAIDPDNRLLFVSASPSIFAISASRKSSDVRSVRGAALTSGCAGHLEELRGTVRLCLLQLDRRDVAQGRQLVEQILPFLRADARIVVTVGFEHGSALHLADMVPYELELVALHFLTRRRGQRLAHSGMSFTFRLLRSQPWFGLPLALVAGVPLGAISSVANIVALRRSARASRGSLTSFVMVLGRSNGNAMQLREGAR